MSHIEVGTKIPIYKLVLCAYISVLSLQKKFKSVEDKCAPLRMWKVNQEHFLLFTELRGGLKKGGLFPSRC